MSANSRPPLTRGGISPLCWLTRQRRNRIIYLFAVHQSNGFLLRSNYCRTGPIFDISQVVASSLRFPNMHLTWSI